MTLDVILEEIKKANTIIILAHESPDGDAIGSTLAMEKALRDMGKKADVKIRFSNKFRLCRPKKTSRKRIF